MIPRKVSNQELAELPTKWQNSTVDVSKYIECVLVAYEVDYTTFLLHKEEGGRCQIYKDRFYVA